MERRYRAKNSATTTFNTTISPTFLVSSWGGYFSPNSCITLHAMSKKMYIAVFAVLGAGFCGVVGTIKDTTSPAMAVIVVFGGAIGAFIGSELSK